MSYRLQDDIWTLNLPREHAWVLMALAKHAHDDGTKVFPGNSLVAWMTGYCVKQIKRILKDLRDEYDLIELLSAGDGTQRAEWRIKVENFEALKKAPPAKRGRPRKTGDMAQENGGHGVEKTGDMRVIKGGKPGTFEQKPGTSTRGRGERSVERSLKEVNSQSRREIQSRTSKRQPATPQPVIDYMRSKERKDLHKFARVAERYDFRLFDTDPPDWKVRADLGSTKDEQDRWLHRLGGLSRRIMKERQEAEAEAM